MAGPRRILVLKLGVLGNIVLSLGPFAAIRRHHANARVTLLTSGQFAGWLARAPWFDTVWVDERPRWWDLSGWMRLRRRLIDGRFELAYDLQTSGRSSRYFQLFPHSSRPTWSGIAYGCALPDRDPNRNRMHDIDRQYGQLSQAGINRREPVDLSWSHADIAQFGLPEHFALLVPGSSAHRPKKRWPIQRYSELAAMLASHGMTAVVVGTAPERPLARAISGAIDLTGRTDFAELTSLARAAAVAVGNDTGPMHLFAAAGCPSVALFSCESDPAMCAPRGPVVSVLRPSHLAELDAATVMAAVAAIIPAQAGALVRG
jgi:ADP-heptose:LPS heptosyltransferase